MYTIRYGMFIVATLCLFAAGFAMGPSKAEAKANVAVVFETSKGNITLLLYPDIAPITVANFLKYVEAGFYEGTIFHRVVRDSDFGKIGTPLQYAVPFSIIQGGAFGLGMRQKQPLFPPIVNESAKGLLNTTGTIAMARAGNPDSATSQFFINLTSNPSFDYRMTKSEKEKDAYRTKAGYCAFGKVVRGMDVIEKIKEGKTGKFGIHENVPEAPTIIKRAYVIK